MGSHDDGVQSLAVFVVIGMVITLMIPANANLSSHFYDKVCPEALPVIRTVVQRAINREPRIGASLLRLHFHDCFVNVSYYCYLIQAMLLSHNKNILAFNH